MEDRGNHDGGENRANSGGRIHFQISKSNMVFGNIINRLSLIQAWMPRK